MEETTDRDKRVQQFLTLNQSSTRGKLKIYIGMSAGVGKTYRMLEEAHRLLKAGVNVKLAYVETHGRTETEALVAGCLISPEKRCFIKVNDWKNWMYRLFCSFIHRW